MDKLATTLLFIALAALTVTCAFLKLTPFTFVVLYGGWLYLMQRQGRAILQARRDAQQALVPVRIRRDDDRRP